MKRIELSDKEILRIKEVCKTGEITFSDLARELGVSRSKINSERRKLGLDKTVTRNTNSGIKFNWTKEKDSRLINLYASPKYTVVEIGKMFGISEDTVTKRAKELGLNKVRKSKYLNLDCDELKKAVNTLSVRQIAENVGVCRDTINKALKVLEDKGEIVMKNKERRDVSINTKDYCLDLSNPRYDAPMLSDKWGVSVSTIHSHRRKIFGTFKVQKDTERTTTSAERKVMSILDDMDIVYVNHKRIDKWNVDLYLGNKHIIEVNGVYWHSQPKVQTKDDRKMKYLKDKGYTTLVITDEELSDIEKVKLSIKGFIVSLYRNI